jgi:hypothetical protein
MIIKLIITVLFLSTPLFSICQQIHKIDIVNENIGYKWNVTDSEGRESIWIRRDESNVFDVEITTKSNKTNKAVYIIEINVDSIKAEPVNINEGNISYFKGILSEDKNGIRGTYTYPLTNEVYQWIAEVDYDRNSPYDLQGEWSCTDKGKYYIRQFDDLVYWYGEEKNENPTFSNVAYGTIINDTLYITWVDVPKGLTTHGNGTMSLKIESSYKMDKISATGSDFGGNSWTKIKSVKY